MPPEKASRDTGLARTLFYGDNLGILRHLPDGCIDLVYLDPPWNPKADYNVIFRDESGRKNVAQRQAFQGTWHWGPSAEDHYSYLTQTARNGGRVPAPVSTLIAALRSAIGENQVMAYVVQMSIRLVELHRLLRRTGSLYLHSDPTTSHYLKIVLDALFRAENFRSEITWKRSNVHSDSKDWSAVADKLLYYVKDERAEYTWNAQHLPYSDAYVAQRYRYADPDGRRYMLDNMTSPNPRPNLMYEWKGYQSPPAGWRFERATMERLDGEGRVWYPDSLAKRPRLKRYLAEMPGTLLTNVWSDIPPINSQARERVGWGTQKPTALLRRIIAASSKKGEVVLDPFCGCGTALVAAEELGREWIGVDLTWHAIAVMKGRLRARFGIEPQIEGAPTEVEGARQLSLQKPNGREQFEAWALSLVGAVPHGGPQRKGADQGADGVITFSSLAGGLQTAIVSVKSGHTNASDVQKLRGAMQRHGGSMGIFVTLEKPTGPMRQEAATAGLYHSDVSGRDYERVQILSIDELLVQRRHPDLPPLLPTEYRETLWSETEVPRVEKARASRHRKVEQLRPRSERIREHKRVAQLRDEYAELASRELERSRGRTARDHRAPMLRADQTDTRPAAGRPVE